MPEKKHLGQRPKPEIIKSWSAMRNPHRPQSLFLPADLPDLPLICHICQLICQICHWSARSANDLPMICQICHWSSRSTPDLPDLPIICQWYSRSKKEMPEFFFWGGVICQNVITSRLFSNFTPHHQGLPTYHPKTLICQKKNWGENNHLWLEEQLRSGQGCAEKFQDWPVRQSDLLPICANLICNITFFCKINNISIQSLQYLVSFPVIKQYLSRFPNSPCSIPNHFVSAS